jgi:pimeloyl-ACP methyl ester carboxylesterase
MTASATERIVVLSDGRRLGCAEFGDPAGRPVLYQHGIPGSRLDVAVGAAEAAGHRVRLIALDRPGIGLSDFRPGYRMIDWPPDVVEAADRLGLERFAVLGHSAGVPFALACAAVAPDRLTCCGVVSGAAPADRREAWTGMSAGNRFSYFLGSRLPWLSHLQFALMARVMRGNPAAAMRQMQRLARGADGAFLKDHPDFIGAMASSSRESFRQGSKGVEWQFGLTTRPWGFALEQVAVPVHLWHGEADRNAPPAMGRYLARTVPGCQARFLPGEGHLSALGNHLGEILETLAAET